MTGEILKVNPDLGSVAKRSGFSSIDRANTLAKPSREQFAARNALSGNTRALSDQCVLRWAFFFLAAAATAHAEWTIASAESEAGSAGVVHRHVLLENAADGDHATFELAIFSAKSCALRVIDNPEGERLASMMKLEKYVCGVNGGYFDEQFKPIGLRIVNSQMLTPLKRARLITGVLLASPRGVQIVRAREFSQRQKIEAAIQCGPFLVDRSQRVGGLNNSQQARRTFAATATNERALLGCLLGSFARGFGSDPCYNTNRSGF